MRVNAMLTEIWQVHIIKTISFFFSGQSPMCVTNVIKSQFYFNCYSHNLFFKMLPRCRDLCSIKKIKVKISIWDILRSNGRVDKSMIWGSATCVQTLVLLLPALWPSEIYLTSACLSFCICKMRTINSTSFRGVLWRLIKITQVKFLEQCI